MTIQRLRDFLIFVPFYTKKVLFDRRVDYEIMLLFLEKSKSYTSAKYDAANSILYNFR